MARLEKDFQKNLVRRLRSELPDTIVMKADANQVQGYPDLLILGPRGRYCNLEVKREKSASHRPNQDYFVEKINDDGGFAAFIYPENQDEIMQAVKDYFGKE